MVDRPIIFSAPMVRALIEGRKTMTRRILRDVPFEPVANCLPRHERKHPYPYLDAYCGEKKTGSNPRGMSDRWCWWQVDDRQCLPTFRVPYVPGDRLWVRENHRFRGADYGDSDGEIEWFRCYGGVGATDSWDPEFPDGFSPSDHDGVRLLTEPEEQEGDGIEGYVTRLRPSIHMPRWASRLTLIVESVKVERLQNISEADAACEGALIEYGDGASISERRAFELIWKHLNGEDAWTANPFVAAISFRVVKANIDAIDIANRPLVCEGVTP